MIIGVCGVGTVGSAVADGFESLGHEILKHDPAKGYAENLLDSDIVFICVYDKNAVEAVVEEWQLADIIAIKTTLMPGTTDKLINKYGKHIVYVPEFLTEKTSKKDFRNPDKIVYGGRAVPTMLKKLHEPFGEPLIMSPTEAEILKLSLNAHHAIKVTFANEVYDLCEKYGADYENVRKGLGADRYVCETHLDVLQDGFRGFGGKCLPKDTDMFIRSGLQKDYVPTLASCAKRINALRGSNNL